MFNEERNAIYREIVMGDRIHSQLKKSGGKVFIKIINKSC